MGALANIGHQVSDQTVGNVLRRHGIEPAPRRSQNTTWREFIESHMEVLAGIDFFTVEVLTWRGLVTYYVHSSGKPACERGWDHETSRRGLDATDGSQCDR